MSMIQPVIRVSREKFPIPKPPVIDKIIKPVEPAPVPVKVPTVIRKPSPLQELVSVEELIIARHLALKSTLLLRGKKSNFSVTTPDKDLIYTVEELSSWWSGYILYAHRPFNLLVRNINGDVVMKMERPYAMSARVVPCQTQLMRVFAPEDTPIGMVEQKWTAVKPVYIVRNKSGIIIFRIKGPFVTINYLRIVRFTITRPDGTLVGETDKKREGVMHTLFFSSLNHKYGLHFDADLTADEKALLLAATLLLNYMYYDD